LGECGSTIATRAFKFKASIAAARAAAVAPIITKS
jgi:hypothetical protein